MGKRHAKGCARIDGTVVASLFALEEREESIEEVDQAGVLPVSATAMVGCLEVSMMQLVGMPWRAVSAPPLPPSVWGSYLLDASSLLQSLSYLLILLMHLKSERDSLHYKTLTVRSSGRRSEQLNLP